MERALGEVVPARAPVVGRDDDGRPAAQARVGLDGVQDPPDLAVGAADGGEVAAPPPHAPGPPVARRVGVAQVDERVLERLGAHVGQEPVDEPLGVGVEHERVDLVAAVVVAGLVGGAVRLVVADVEERELRLRDVGPRPEPGVVRDVEHARDVLAPVRVQRDARGRVHVDRPGVAGVAVDGPAGKLARVVGERVPVVRVGPGVLGEGPLAAEPGERGQGLGRLARHGVGPEAVDGDVDHVADRVGVAGPAGPVLQGPGLGRERRDRGRGAEGHAAREQQEGEQGEPGHGAGRGGTGSVRLGERTVLNDATGPEVPTLPPRRPRRVISSPAHHRPLAPTAGAGRQCGARTPRRPAHRLRAGTRWAGPLTGLDSRRT